MNFKALFLILAVGILLGMHVESVLLAGMVVATGVLLTIDRHISVALIQLEMLTLLTATALLTRSWQSSLSTTLFLLFFTVGVIEATLGLALLASASRKLSTELFKFML